MNCKIFLGVYFILRESVLMAVSHAARRQDLPSAMAGGVRTNSSRITMCARYRLTVTCISHVERRLYYRSVPDAALLLLFKVKTWLHLKFKKKSFSNVFQKS